MSMWEPFTDRARRTVVLAQEEAMRLRHRYIGTEHLLLGILSEGDSIAAQACVRHGITLKAARDVVESISDPGFEADWRSELVFTPRARRVVEIAHDVARGRGENYVGTETLFVAIFKEGAGAGYRALIELGLGELLASMSAGQLPGSADQLAGGTQ